MGELMTGIACGRTLKKPAAPGGSASWSKISIPPIMWVP